MGKLTGWILAVSPIRSSRDTPDPHAKSFELVRVDLSQL